MLSRMKRYEVIEKRTYYIDAESPEEAREILNDMPEVIKYRDARCSDVVVEEVV